MKLKITFLILIYLTSNTKAWWQENRNFSNWFPALTSSKLNKKFFLTFSFGSHNETLSHYREKLKEGEKHIPYWSVELFNDYVPEFRISSGYVVSKNAFVLSIGMFETNKAIFYYKNVREGYNSITARFMRFDYNYYPISFLASFTSKKHAKRFCFLPYCNIGVGWYFISWEWESEHIYWYNLQTGEIANGSFQGHTNIIGYHFGIGVDFILRQNIILGIKFSQLYGSTEKLYADFAGSNGECYWWDGIERFKIELSGSSLTFQVGIVW